MSREISDDWCAPFPGPADLNFNFRKLMDESPNGLGAFAEPQAAGQSGQSNDDDSDDEDENTDLPTVPRVAVIGAGAAGLTAVRELLRIGVSNVDLYEASGRYGGRFWTKTLPDHEGQKQYTTMEAGAMRMPPFISEEVKARAKKEHPDNPKHARKHAVRKGNSILSYYLEKFDISTDEFPNPGALGVRSGIYINRGYGVGGKRKTQDLIDWPANQNKPSDDEIAEVKKISDDFFGRMKESASQVYGTPNWQTYWEKLVHHYFQKTFRDVVFEKTNKGSKDAGNFGGMGMTERQARIFYVIGAGDGGWGSFFNLSFLYVYRTFVGGYSSDLQVIEGLFKGSTFVAGEMHKDDQRPVGPKIVTDSLGNELPNPEYLGTSTITDCILFKSVDRDEAPYSQKESAGTKDGFHMFFNSPVSRIIKKEDGKIQIRVKADRGREEAKLHAADYDAVICTVPTHQFGTEVRMEGFDRNQQWPVELETYLSRAHWEPCVKVFVELHESYWDKENAEIPQTISSDTFLRDTYGVKINKGGNQTGTCLLSYTWWRDATKLVCYADQELINMAVAEADRMLSTCEGIDDQFANYIKYDLADDGTRNYRGWVHHWELQKTYKGAARLYDQRTWRDTNLPMIYNQKHSKKSGVYLAGEAYHVDAGWVEPSFRTAVEAVCRIIHNNNGKLNAPININWMNNTTFNPIGGDDHQYDMADQGDEE